LKLKKIKKINSTLKNSTLTINLFSNNKTQNSNKTLSPSKKFLKKPPKMKYKLKLDKKKNSKIPLIIILIKMQSTLKFNYCNYRKSILIKNPIFKKNKTQQIPKTFNIIKMTSCQNNLISWKISEKFLLFKKKINLIIFF
jgi:hypothetical protein